VNKQGAHVHRLIGLVLQADIAIAWPQSVHRQEAPAENFALLVENRHGQGGERRHYYLPELIASRVGIADIKGVGIQGCLYFMRAVVSD